MRRAIVHIGLPRTGTTSIQRVLTRLRPALAASGILYPDLTPRSAPEPHLSHQHLGETLDGRRPRHERTELLASLASQLADSRADTVILSYEHLCLLPPRRGVAGLLARFFTQHGFGMEILATIKPQAEFLNSAYTWRTQFLRESRDFAAFVGAELGRRTLDYAALFEPWRRAAAGRIAVLPLRDPRAPDTLLARFLGTPGLSRARSLLTEDDLGLIENRSPGPVAVEVCRRLRDQGAHRQLGPRTRDATRFIEDACRQRNLDATPFRGVDPALRATIQSRCRKANDRLAATVWFEPWSARVAPAPEAPVNELARTLDPAALHHVDAIEQAVHDRFALCRDKRFLGLRPGRLLRRLALAHAHR